ncbi:MAG: MerR family transcriptional regulator [Paracoccaceae bacterium]|nr:MerR family transcriptional regulator [Paracoccaceae bacterium]
MEKSPEAFRTISEVADWLGTPTHVLRFWESRFAQVKPVKRAGGRRYYRPNDMLLLGGIKKLLHDDGMTIRGVQKMLREEGVKQIASYSQALDGFNQREAERAEVENIIEAMVEAQATPKAQKPVDPAPAQAEWSFETARSRDAADTDQTVSDTVMTEIEDGDDIEEAEMAVDVPQEPLDNVVDLEDPSPPETAEPPIDFAGPAIPKISVPADMSDHEDFAIARDIAETASRLRYSAGYDGKRPGSLVGLTNIHDRLTALQARMNNRRRNDD